MMKFADVHSHFVYGVDDGAKTQEEMKAMLDAAWQDDVTTLVATPP
ncbi:MAG: CpsB/CapC family capsule biosynthesis tyrosine phosphatase [Lachnospiraceae bacterium]